MADVYETNPYFGERWHPPTIEHARQVPAPLGVPCLHCGEPIAEGDQGFLIGCVEPDGVLVRPVHRECSLRMVIGGLNHLQGTCSCQGGRDDPDPPQLSRREAAIAASQYFYAMVELS